MKILLVDDSKSARYALRLQLQRHGIEVETADSAESAFAILADALPDAILMDHTMPGMNGFEALEVIQADPRTAHLPVVMCTSHEDADFAATAKRKGVAGILPKSVAPEKLPDVLAQLRKDIGSGPAQPPSVPRPTAPSTQPAPPPPAVAPKSAGMDSRIGAQMDALLDAKMDKRLDQRIETRISNLLEDLRRDLAERLMAETHRVLDERLNETVKKLGARIDKEQHARELAQRSNAQPDLSTLTNRLASETLPDLVKIEIEAERVQIMDMVEQYLREFRPPTQDGAKNAEQLASMETNIVNKAQDAARREFNGEIKVAMEHSDQNLVTVTDQVNARFTRVYLSIFVSALVGIGAALGVYFLLR